MPWEHCGHTIGDERPCPDCGLTKSAWTVKLDKTRLFKLDTPYEGDAEAQVVALKAAAEEGAPFCAKCEEAKRQRAAAEAAQKEQAGALRSASEEGAPFCAVCEQRRREREQAAREAESSPSA